MHEAAAADIRQYASFSEFFVRALRSDARRWPDAPTTIASPVDGTASQAGTLQAGMLLQAKGIDYPLQDLLGDDPGAYLGGGFATLYLRPRDYHRVHMPVAGRLTGVRHLPGRLWPVRPWAVSHVPGLFTRNERLVLEFLGLAGPWALILVGALMVGSMETVVTGSVRSGRGNPLRWNLEAAPRHFERGDEIARFHFGSTVILVFGPAQVAWDADILAPGCEVRLGQSIGKYGTTGDRT